MSETVEPNKGQVKENNPIWITTPVVLALLTLLTYLIAYFFEFGYYSRFAIPLSLIRLDTVALFNAAGTLIVLTGQWVILFTFPEAIMSIKRDVKTFNRMLFALCFMFSVGAVLMPAALFFGSLIPLITFYFMLRVDWSDYRTIDHSKPPKNNPFSVVAAKMGFWPARASKYIAVLALSAAGIGYLKAWQQSYFLVPIANPNTVVLKICGDTVICAKADLTKHEIYPIFFFYPLTSDSLNGMELRQLKGMRVIKPLPSK